MEIKISLSAFWISRYHLLISKIFRLLISDILNSIFDISNWISDISNSIQDILNCISDISNLISDIFNCISDISNSI